MIPHIKMYNSKCSANKHMQLQRIIVNIASDKCCHPVPNAKIASNCSTDNIRSKPVICYQGRDTIATLWMDTSRQNVPFWDVMNQCFVELWQLISVFVACLVKYFSQIIQINHEKVSFKPTARKDAVHYKTHAHGSPFSVFMVMTVWKTILADEI